ncbi:hypothetical protein EG834_10455, partial [bacterium]|nr:hypothetical protein [bacterium]
MKRRWWLVVILIAAVPITSLFLGIRLPGDGSVTLPNVPREFYSPALMFFQAVPWVIAAGLFGPLPAVVISLLSGLFFGLWETHSIFTPLEFAILALFFTAAVRQQYRTSFYHFLRNPLGATVVVGFLYIPISLLTAFFSASGDLAVRLDYALTGSWMMLMVRIIELVIASVIAEIVYLVKPKLWSRQGPLVPSPSETSMQTRFFLWTFPLIVALLFTILVGDWVVAGNAARNMIRERLSSTALVASDSLPYFMESGQGLLAGQARPALLELSGDGQQVELQRMLHSVPFFNRLGLFDAQGNLIAQAPADRLFTLADQEKVGVNLALKGVLGQTYTLKPISGEASAQVVFVSAIQNETGQAIGVLMGWTDLQANPFTQPAIQALRKISEMGGEGSILNEDRQILYNTLETSTLVMSDYLGKVPSTPDFFEETSQMGTRRMVFSQPGVGRPWTVVVSLPSEIVQSLAL